jgi:hypothetical protein
LWGGILARDDEVTHDFSPEYTPKESATESVYAGIIVAEKGSGGGWMLWRFARLMIICAP